MNLSSRAKLRLHEPVLPSEVNLSSRAKSICHPERSRFVIPSEVEGSGGYVHSYFDRSGEICPMLPRFLHFARNHKLRASLHPSTLPPSSGIAQEDRTKVGYNANTTLLDKPKANRPWCDDYSV